jgi:hypothetical protein
MLDEDNHPVERIVAPASASQETQAGAGEKVPSIYYLHIPAGKTKVMRDKLRKVNPPAPKTTSAFRRGTRQLQRGP